MGLELSIKDKDTIIRFCKCIGLNPNMISDQERDSDFREDLYWTSGIRWGDQDFARDLIKLGMEYEYSINKRKRVKTSKLKRERTYVGIFIGVL